MSKISVLTILVILIASCKKTIEIREVQIEKKNSWEEIRKFTGTERIFLSSGKSDNAVYLQQPNYFTEIRNQNISTGITTFGVSLPSDINVKIPINGKFFAFPSSDTTLDVINNLYPTVNPSGGYFNLKQVDPTLKSIQKNYLNLFKIMAINKNGTLLLAYYNNRPSRPLTLMMLKIKTNLSFPYVDTVFCQSITVPRTSFDAYVRHISAVNDYFLLDLSANGIFKIKEDGSFSRVYNPKTIDAFYEWGGKVYAHVEWNRVLISSNNGDNWQEYTGTNTTMTLSTYYNIQDSLVGANRDNLFTLKWNGQNYVQRFLKNDGLESTTINGVEFMRDSVYIATTSGLFVKPISTFFETK
jgi:hypothetical protein